MICRLAFLAFMSFSPAALVSACEGECITGIRKALVGNYSVPFALASQNIADTIFSRLIPNGSSQPIAYISPIVEEYHRRAEDYMENTIFKTYFHGKCQDPVTNIDPPGCPNPDCPVVCGTPGSMVHFYPVFRYRAFNSTVNLWNEIIDTDSTQYKLVERAVLAAGTSSSSTPNRQRRTQLRRFMRFARPDWQDFEEQSQRKTTQLSADDQQDNSQLDKRDTDPKIKELRTYLRSFRQVLTTVCGGSVTGKTNNLPDCSWEQSFKEYILSFP